MVHSQSYVCGVQSWSEGDACYCPPRQAMLDMASGEDDHREPEAAEGCRFQEYTMNRALATDAVFAAA